MKSGSEELDAWSMRRPGSIMSASGGAARWVTGAYGRDLRRRGQSDVLERHTYQYDAFNNMWRMKSGAEEWLCVYTADGERVWSFTARKPEQLPAIVDVLHDCWFDRDEIAASRSAEWRGVAADLGKVRAG